MNVKRPYEGRRFNDIYREPLKSRNSDQPKHPSIIFLQNLLEWLQVWKASVPVAQAVSAQTFQAWINTTRAFLALIPYLFQNYRIDYILLSKFQNDVLEGRFSHYRQLSGANYYIGYVQLLESERKIRIKNTLTLTKNNTTISLKNLLCSLETKSNILNCTDVEIDVFSPIFQEIEEFSLQLIPDDALPIITYIAGYAVKKELRLQKCDTCSSWLQLEGKDVEVDLDSLAFNFILELDRGKLTLPNEFSLSAVAVSWFILNKMFDGFYEIFLKTEKPLAILFSLSLIFVKKYCETLDILVFSVDETWSCSCKVEIFDKLKALTLRACKVFINNFVKNINNECQSSASSKKKSFGDYETSKETDKQRKIRKLC